MSEEAMYNPWIKRIQNLITHASEHGASVVFLSPIEEDGHGYLHVGFCVICGNRKRSIWTEGNYEEIYRRIRACVRLSIRERNSGREL